MGKKDTKYIHFAFAGDDVVKVAVIGSRNLTVPNLGDYLPTECIEIISGGAKGVDTSAREYAETYGIKLTEFLPNYSKFGRGAPLKRNLEIIKASDMVLAFWDGKSKGTAYVIKECEKLGKSVRIIQLES